MPEYLKYQFIDSHGFVNTFDELPLWSASFGLLLFKHLELRSDLTVLDIGSGAGFPLLELAQRLGSSCKCYGLDPWTHANMRAKQKIVNYEVTNAEIIDGTADNIPFDNDSIDLIVSNLGINNFNDPALVFRECHRVLAPGGKLALTTNLCGHFREFYQIFEATLLQLNKTDLIADLKKEEEHRGTIDTISELFANSGIKVSRYFEEKFEMKFLNGSAFLNHHFIKLGWLGSWKKLIPESQQQHVFTQLENNLNVHAVKNGGLTLTVPMAYIEGQK